MKKAENIITAQQERQAAFNRVKRAVDMDLQQAELWADFCNLQIDLQEEKEKAFFTLACVIVRGTLRKLIDKTGEPMFYTLKAQVEQDLCLYEDTQTLNEKATAYKYNDNGEKVQYIADADADRALKVLEKQSTGEGFDLVQVAYIALLEQAKQHSAKGGGWLDIPFAKRVLDKRVIIRRADSAAYKEIEETPIKEIYRAVRQAIDKSASVQAASLKYTYLEELTEQEGEKAYRRLPKYMDAGAEDKDGIYTADAQTADDMFSTIEKLNLSDRQMQILKLRLKGYGQRAIASYLGVSVRCIQIQLQRVQEKAKQIELVPVCKA